VYVSLSKFVEQHSACVACFSWGGLGVYLPRKFLKISSFQVESGGHFQLKSVLFRSKTIYFYLGDHSQHNNIFKKNQQSYQNIFYVHQSYQQILLRLASNQVHPLDAYVNVAECNW